MLKKTIAILAFAVAAVMPTAPAAAWNQVCMKFPLWKTWFSGHFYVVHGFNEHLGVLPKTYFQPGNNRGWYVLPDRLGGDDRARANGRISSPNISVNRTKCVNISEIPHGDPFFVYLQPDAGHAAVVCATHPNNPNQWYHQTTRPYNTLNYEGWGGVAHPKCRFTHES